MARSPIHSRILGRASFIGKGTTAWDLARLERLCASQPCPTRARLALPRRLHAGGRGLPPLSARAFANARGLSPVAGRGVTVLHQAGWITKARHDSGLVYSSGDAFVVTVLTWNGGGVGSASDLLATRVAQAAIDRLLPLRRFVPPLLREDLVFRRFSLAQTISLFGDQISMIAIPLAAVLVLDANAAQMGYLVAAELTPNLLFALHAGAWIDRRGRRRQR